MELLERDQLLRELEAALGDAARGDGRLALVSGEAGLGKTALIEAFRRAHRNTVRLLWGACDAVFTPRPLGPLHDMAPSFGSDWLERLNTGGQAAALSTAFLAELQQRPALVIFEDIHWADEATLDLLKYLGRRIAGTSALVVLTYRDKEVGPRHPLRAMLGDLATSSTVIRLAVTPLSERAVQTLVGQRMMNAATLHQ